MKKEEPIKNLNIAFECAEQEFDIPPLLDAPGIIRLVEYDIYYVESVCMTMFVRNELILAVRNIEDFGVNFLKSAIFCFSRHIISVISPLQYRL